MFFAQLVGQNKEVPDYRVVLLLKLDKPSWMDSICTSRLARDICPRDPPPLEAPQNPGTPPDATVLYIYMYKVGARIRLLTKNWMWGSAYRAKGDSESSIELIYYKNTFFFVPLLS